MNRFLRLELERYRRTFLYVLGVASFSLVTALYFFAIVGKFDDSPDSEALREYGVIIPLALTVALCVIVIYGAVVHARHIVADYVGNRRIQLYSYPGGRRSLFLAKNFSYIIAVGSGTFLGFSLGVSLFLILESVVPVVSLPPEKWVWLTSVWMSLCVAILAISSILIAGIVGVHRGSTIATIVGSVLLVGMLGNIVGFSLSVMPWVTVVLTGGSGVVVAVLLLFQSRRIAHDEVL